MPANIAILIDAENVDPSFANQIFSYARSLGEVTVREIYGAGIALNEWADPILENTIHTNFTLRPNRFKNSSDIALTIGAMELLHTSQTTEDKKVDAVIIASSDSDFSPLAFHLRAAGIDVIGMGEQGRINPMWPKACTEFVTLTPGQPLVRRREPPIPPSDTVVVEVPSVESLSAQPFSAQPLPTQPQEESLVGEPQEVPQAEPPIGEPPKVKIEAKPTSKVKEPPAQSEEKVKVKIAHSHSARVQLIRSFITEQLAAHGGRIKSGELFKALASVPDYKFDQQRSRRKPLDYLETQYSAWFALEPGEKGSYWISLRSVADSHTEQKPVAEEKPITSIVDDEQPAVIDEHFSADEKETADEQPIAEEQPAPEEEAPSCLPDDSRVALIEAGIPIQDTDRVAAILSESKNLFAAYNGLTKAFGRKMGGQYYQLIKEHFTAALPSVATENAAKMTTPSTGEEMVEQEEATGHRPEPEQSEEKQVDVPLERFLIDHDLPTDRAATVCSIVAGTANLRIAYNELRKAFGAEKGRSYLAMVKEYKGVQS